MTTAAPGPGPVRASTPRPKGMPTAATSLQNAAAAATSSASASTSTSDPSAAPAPAAVSTSSTSNSPSNSKTRPDDRAPPSRPALSAANRRSTRPPPNSTDFLSDKATAAFIRRILCSQHLNERERDTPAPIEDLLPPLTSRNDVDLHLYALLAVVLRDFVQAWYNKITSDESFVDEIVHVIAHCTRALEQRLRKVDLESLLFDEIPDLLDRHIIAYRTAHELQAQPPTTVDPREVYHSLCPLAPLSPVPKPKNQDRHSAAKQRENEALYRQLLVEGALAVLLPTEDLENPCLTALVGQICSELIIGNLFVNKLSQPWMLWECFIILARVLGRQTSGTRDAPEDGIAEALSQSSADATATDTSRQQRQPVPRGSWSLQSIFWSCLNFMFLVFTVVRVSVLTLASASSLPSRLDPSYEEKRGTAEKRVGSEAPKTGPHSTTRNPAKVPIATYRVWTCASDLIELDSRMPWLSGALSLLQLGALKGPGRFAALDGPLDRLVSHAIRTRVLDPSHLPQLLRAVRGALFPNNAPGISTLVAPSSDEELLALRRRCASALGGLLPPWLAGLYFGGRGLAAFGRRSSVASSTSGSGSASGSTTTTTTVSGSTSGVPDGNVLSQRRAEPGGEESRARPGREGESRPGASRSANGPDVPESTPHSRSAEMEGTRSEGEEGEAAGRPHRDGGGGPNDGGRAVGASLGAEKHHHHQYQQQQSSLLPLPHQQQKGEAEVARRSGNDDPNSNKQQQTEELREHQDEEHIGQDSARLGGEKRAAPQSFSPSGKGEAGDKAKDANQERILAEIEEGLLDVFSDEYCNKHLMYGLLELVLVRLMPELTEKGVAELWEERLS